MQMKPDMGSPRQMFDDLTAHIALFHASSRPTPSNPNPRKAILRWFSSLSVQQRQACLTVVDSDFVKILLQMLARIQTDGRCHFFILPDLPSAPGSSLPSLCHRLSGGLLSRAGASNESERLISSSVRLFASEDGDRGTDSALDSMSVSEDLVKDPEQFAAAMDEASSGEFLRQHDVNTSQSPWVELEWLKAKGYYSMASFISNKLELALRISWLEKNSGKKPRAGKQRSKVPSAGVAANVFWRQKACLDWWLGLDRGVRKKVYQTLLCKGAKTLVKEIIERRLSDLKDESASIWIRSKSVASYNSISPFQRMSESCCSLDPTFFFGSDALSSSRKPCRLASLLNQVLVLREISEKLSSLLGAECDSEALFFSKLDSMNDVSDCIVRRLRCVLVSLWKEFIKIELAGDLTETFCKVKKKSHNSKRQNSSAKSSKLSHPEQGNTGKSKEISKKTRTGSTPVQEKITNKEVLKPQTGTENAVVGLRVNNKKSSSSRKRSKIFKKSTCKELHTTEENEVAKSTQFSDSLSLGFLAESQHSNQMNDAPLENEIIKQSASEDAVRCSPVEPDKSLENVHHGTMTREGLKKFSGRETFWNARSGWKREEFWSEDEIGLRNQKMLADSAPRVASVHSQCHSPAAGILHLDSNQREQSLYPLNSSHQGVDTSSKAGVRQVFSPRVLPVSFDWPLMVRGSSGLNLDAFYNSRSQSALCSSANAHGTLNISNDSDGMYSGDVLDDSERYWVSEDESDLQTLSGRDYNKLFGGGVMYWNTSDHISPGFSQAPSHSSDDSSWAWHEADLNRAIDDMVGYALPGNDVSGLQSVSTMVDHPEEKHGFSEAAKGDSLSYPVLRPIIIPNISRKGSRSEFKINLGHTSPSVGSNRRDFPRIKRPSSPVVLCVPRDPRPALPCVGDSRKSRGFPVVRSGSSSPRSWGMRSFHHEENASPGTTICFDGGEIIWTSWENGKHVGPPLMQAVPGSMLQDRLIAISHRDQEHPDIMLPIRAADSNCPSRTECLPVVHNLLHEEIDTFCKKVAAENLSRKPYINWAVKRVAKSLQVLWPRSRTSVFGSNATGLALPSSDVDLVVCLPPVRNLEPIKEAGILEGRNGIKETCLQHAARYLANQDWVKSDSLKTIENTAIPLIMLVAEVPLDTIDVPDRRSKGPLFQRTKDLSLTKVPLDTSVPKDLSFTNLVRLDISFRSSTHTGLQTTEMVRQLSEQFPASIPLALVLKQFLADRNLDRSYSGGLSSYCLVLLIIRFLQHEHHLGRSNSQNLGSLLMDFLYFFGNVFDPRQMHVSIQGSGIYMKRERGHGIDPIHIDDPLCTTNNVGKNCFRIHQCIKAFADAYSTLDNHISSLSSMVDSRDHVPFSLLRKIIPSIDSECS